MVCWGTVVRSECTVLAFFNTHFCMFYCSDLTGLSTVFAGTGHFCQIPTPSDAFKVLSSVYRAKMFNLLHTFECRLCQPPGDG